MLSGLEKKIIFNFGILEKEQNVLDQETISKQTNVQSCYLLFEKCIKSIYTPYLVVNHRGSMIVIMDYKYQPRGKGGARSPLAMPHRLQNLKWPPGGPKTAEGVWKGVYPRFLGILSNFR